MHRAARSPPGVVSMLVGSTKKNRKNWHAQHRSYTRLPVLDHLHVVIVSRGAERCVFLSLFCSFPPRVGSFQTCMQAYERRIHSLSHTSPYLSIVSSAGPRAFHSGPTTQGESACHGFSVKTLEKRLTDWTQPISVCLSRFLLLLWSGQLGAAENLPFSSQYAFRLEIAKKTTDAFHRMYYRKEDTRPRGVGLEHDACSGTCVEGVRDLPSFSDSRQSLKECRPP